MYWNLKTFARSFLKRHALSYRIIQGSKKLMPTNSLANEVKRTQELIEENTLEGLQIWDADKEIWLDNDVNTNVIEFSANNFRTWKVCLDIFEFVYKFYLLAWLIMELRFYPLALYEITDFCRDTIPKIIVVLSWFCIPSYFQDHFFTETTRLTYQNRYPGIGFSLIFFHHTSFLMKFFKKLVIFSNWPRLVVYSSTVFRYIFKYLRYCISLSCDY